MTVLNALVAQYAVTALLSLIGSGPFRRGDHYLHMDWLTRHTLVASSMRKPDCPACGERGFLFAGADASAAPSGSEPSWEPVGNGLDRPLNCDVGGSEGV